jgi:hypothetical protein
LDHFISAPHRLLHARVYLQRIAWAWVAGTPQPQLGQVRSRIWVGFRGNLFRHSAEQVWEQNRVLRSFPVNGVVQNSQFFFLSFRSLTARCLAAHWTVQYR